MENIFLVRSNCFVVSQFVRSVLVIVLARWRPTRFGDISAAIELIKFGLTLLNDF